MRQLLEARLAGRAQIVGTGSTPDDAVAATADLEPDVVVLDFRTAVGSLEESVAAIKEAAADTTVVVHTGVPRYLIEEEVQATGAIYSPKNEPEHLVEFVRTVIPLGRGAASRDS